ncbi:hypothetical protein J5N97_007243 [Dioscorea zingiberensis]|uniref:[RNA-polymerase]-subunit kinase n=1 Tax=Dioscorea zingiberensis TaxID=325984 RepID=A0A9D5DEF7_9LILI|nr:hypothetical protein J5N97_007243 [Dioscorea zingiberensis]
MSNRGSQEAGDGQNHKPENCKLVKELGSGTYGTVYEVTDITTGNTVAVKRINFFMHYNEDDAICTARREIDILSSCHHPNIISFKDSFIDHNKQTVFIVMEHAGTDLRTYLNNHNKHERMKESTVKGLVFQLLSGVAYLHSKKMVHRDLKPDNLLLKDKLELKICDFGLSKRLEVVRDHGECDQLSRVVVSRWYRSPELLLGVEKYTTGIDVWSVGCIMAEMVMNKVLFPGVSEVDQLNRIFLVMGSPELETWPGLDELEMGRVVLRGRRRYNRLRSNVPARGEIKKETMSSKGSQEAGDGQNHKLENYKLVKELGSGTYGTVYQATDITTGNTVAVKRIHFFMHYNEDDAICTARREIDILSSCHHPNIISFKTSFIDHDHHAVFLVTEHASTDLKTYLARNKHNHEHMKEPTVKKLMRQLLRGVAYLHSNRTLHRDLKPQNILLVDNAEEDQQLKICDFGLSKRLGVQDNGECGDQHSQTVATRWYRSPELLLGEKKYMTEIDVWSVGCIMAEMATKRVLFPGTTEISQLHRILTAMSLSEFETWPGFDQLKKDRAFMDGRRRYRPLRSRVPESVMSDVGFDLLKKLLALNPERRITAKDALEHAWFNEEFEKLSLS